MKKPSTDEIRNIFLSFFREKAHLLISGDSILPKDDPTLLYINSGMAPLKPYFLGKAKPESPRLANVQACIRTNDIEEVGDRQHLTFFEMMGSWSIGDYYKQKAIELAFELLVERFQFEPDKLYATVFCGNEALGLAADEQSAEIWERVGLKPSHVVPLGMDNFWGPAGDTGPCGPCTEVFYDTGEAYGPTFGPGVEFDSKRRYIEIWNAGVFMEYDKHADGRLSPLPLKSVDTGSGLERMQLAINGYETVYETDLLTPILDRVIATFGQDLSERERFLLTDHMKATTFILSEGVVPTNIGQGYIPRRLIRKSVAAVMRSGHRGQKLVEVVDAVIERMHRYYPRLHENRSLIIEHLLSEVNDFEPVIEAGLEKLEQRIAGHHAHQVSGEIVFDIVTTHGVPLEIVGAYLDAKSLTFSEDEYWKAFRRHQEISRGSLVYGNLYVLDDNLSATNFVGYEKLNEEGTILRLVARDLPVDSVKENEPFLLIVDRTPFYAEAGGEVGDTGTGTTATGKFEITNTIKEKDVYVHHAVVLSGRVEVNQQASLHVDSERRCLIERNHTATHLLHSALRKTLGTHVIQQGSLVAPDRLRFDFRHGGAMSREEIKAVENQVNEWIRQNIPIHIGFKSYQEAVASGAMALFTENYGDLVRVITIDEASSELCGGAHVRATGEIGLFLVNNERSVSSGIRRIEAITGTTALRSTQDAIETIRDAARALNTSPSNVLESIYNILKPHTIHEHQTIKDELTQYEYKKIVDAGADIKVVICQSNGSADTLRELAGQFIDTEQCQIVIIISNRENRLTLMVMVESSVKKTLPARELLEELLPLISGRGGGNDHLAMGGSKEIHRIGDFIQKAEDVIRKFSARASH